MKPVDFRNETFEQLQGRLAGLREVVLAAWRQHGPGTTEELATRSGIPILTLRPRTTELFQLGFLKLDDTDPGKGAGRYRARNEVELRTWFFVQHRAAQNSQPELALGV